MSFMNWFFSRLICYHDPSGRIYRDWLSSSGGGGGEGDKYCLIVFLCALLLGLVILGLGAFFHWPTFGWL